MPLIFAHEKTSSNIFVQHIFEYTRAAVLGSSGIRLQAVSACFRYQLCEATIRWLQPSQLQATYPAADSSVTMNATKPPSKKVWCHCGIVCLEPREVAPSTYRTHMKKVKEHGNGVVLPPIPATQRINPHLAQAVANISHSNLLAYERALPRKRTSTSDAAERQTPHKRHRVRNGSLSIEAQVRVSSGLMLDRLLIPLALSDWPG